MSLLKRCKYIFFNSSINCLTSFSVSSLRHHSQKRPAHMKCLVESAAEHVRNNPAERALMTWHCYSSWDSLKDYWNGSCMSHVGKKQDTVSDQNLIWVTPKPTGMKSLTPVESFWTFIHTFGALLRSNQPEETNINLHVINNLHFILQFYFIILHTTFFFNTRMRKTLFIKRVFPEVSHVEHWRKNSSGRMIKGFEKLT